MTAAGSSFITARRLAFVAGGIALLVLGGWVLRPSPLPVDVVEVRRGPLRVTIDEDGETRVRDRYVVSAPVAGRLLRIALEPGARVVAETTELATFRPVASGLLDERTRSQLQARVAAAQAAVHAAQAERERASVQLAQAERDLTRARQLVAAGAASRERLEAAELATTTSRKAVDLAQANLAAARAEERVARAGLARPDGAASGPVVVLRAPVDGVVLRRLRESEAVVAQGEPILEIGDVSQLEVVADYLSTDAVRLRPGQPAFVTRWGGEEALVGRVRLIEPAGFTKVSALGVEEQRVNVVIALDAEAGGGRLGDHFRVEVQVVVWEAEAVTTVPIGSLVREGEGWSVFAVRDGRAVRTPVTVGMRNDSHAQITAGVEPGQAIIAFPGSGVSDGTRVVASR